MKNKKTLIIDTDPGIDDALAMIALINSDKIDIKAISTVSGNSDIQTVTNNADFVLKLLNNKSPLYSGSNKPLVGKQIKANIHGKYGLGNVSVKNFFKLNEEAVDKIIEIVKSNPYQISILAIGPLTNIALAFRKDPKLPNLIKELVIMGGAITEPGNKNRVAEFNFFVDPEAASEVLNSLVKKVLIPLDLCMKIPLYLEDFKQLEGSKNYKIIHNMIKGYLEKTLKYEKKKGAYMFDPLAAYYLINSDAYKLEEMDIRIETRGELTRGMSVADRRTWGGSKPNISVAISVNRDQFISDFLNLLK